MPDEERVYYAEWMAVERLCMYDEDEKTREKQTSVHTMRFRRAFKVPVCLWLCKSKQISTCLATRMLARSRPRTLIFMFYIDMCKYSEATVCVYNYFVVV